MTHVEQSVQNQHSAKIPNYRLEQPVLGRKVYLFNKQW
jgi:hypothetical protein